MLQILPSLLAADYGRLASEIARAHEARADALHLDIMDPHFVPNMSFGPDVVALSKRVAPDFRRNVHLMMSRPDLYLERFAEAGADTIQVHLECDTDVHNAIRKIASLGVRPAIVINPETPKEALIPYLDEVDEVLVMTVRPGYGGQKFMADCLEKTLWLRAQRPDMDIMVDGGINGETAICAARAGVNQFVSGSYLFGKTDMKSAIAELRAKLEEAVR